MRRHLWLTAMLLCASAVASGASTEKCTIGKIAELPVSMTERQARTSVNINGVDLQFVIDSGNFYTAIPQAVADQLKLKYHISNTGFYSVGVGDSKVDTSIARVRTMTMPGLRLTDTDVLVGISEVGGAGLLGQDILHRGDIEYDFAHGAVRMFEEHNCAAKPLAYWADGDTAISELDVKPETTWSTTHTGSRVVATLPDWLYTDVAIAYLNGQKIRVIFDTGAATSYLTADAAAKVGIKTDSPGVVSAGYSTGAGTAVIANFIARFDSFKIGQEEIRNARLRIGVGKLPGSVDMLVGADFFLSHRVYVANAQHKVYFTYNGGPVFDLSTRPGNPGPGTDIAADSGPADSAAATQGADDYARRGEALAARSELDQALAALDRACELAPDHAEYFHRRGLVYWRLKNPAKAVDDFNRAVQLAPNDVAIRLTRAEWRLAVHDKGAAREDLDAADAAAPAQANERLQMAVFYEHAGAGDAALAQADRWIASHPEDARLPLALNTRCWLRAMRGTDLPLALHDCDAAMKLLDSSNPSYAKVADSRGLVFLRMRNYDKAIASYNLSLKGEPRNAWSLYGRAVGELREHRSGEAEADIAQAKALDAGIAESFQQIGVVP